jgi:hypothetical protein
LFFICAFSEEGEDKEENGDDGEDANINPRLLACSPPPTPTSQARSNAPGAVSKIKFLLWVDTQAGIHNDNFFPLEAR